MSFQFEKIDIEKNPEIWNDFVLSKSVADYNIAFNPSLAHFFHQYFNALPEYFLAYDNEKLVGVIPGIRMKNKFISIPIFSSAGFCPDQNSHDSMLYKDFVDYLKTEYEIRSFSKISANSYDDKVNSYINLASTPEDQLKTFNSNHRRKINKGYKNGLTLTLGHQEFLKDFYTIYCKNMHRIGTPVPSIRFFEAFMNQYTHGECLIFLIKKEDQVLGASFYVSYGSYAEFIWGSTIREYNHLYTNMVLYWEMIRHSIEKGYKVFSFGRSTKESSVLEFKLNWEVTTRQIYFNYSGTQKNIRKMAFFTSLWKKLPYRLTLILGPMIRKKILS